MKRRLLYYLAVPSILIAAGCSNTNTDPSSAGKFTATDQILSGRSPLDIAAVWQTDQGRTLRLDELRGQPCVFAMFFANCEGSCVLTIEYLKEIETSLSADTRSKTRFVAVTFDPIHDSASALSAYRSEHQLSDRWIILRGTKQGTAELSQRLSLTFGKQAGGRLVHSNGLTIVDTAGLIVHQQLGLHSDLPAAVSVLNQCAGKSAKSSTE